MRLSELLSQTSRSSKMTPIDKKTLHILKIKQTEKCRGVKSTTTEHDFIDSADVIFSMRGFSKVHPLFLGAELQVIMQ